jgi:hypothetical protein
VRETFDRDARRLLLHFDDRAELEAWVERGRGYGLTARLEERLDDGESVELVLTSPGLSLEVPTRIKQVFRSGRDRFGTIFEPNDWNELELGDGAARQPAGSESQESGDDGERTAAASDGTSEPTSEMSGTSIAFDVRQLNPSERIRLASRASHNERQVLLRDSTPPVAMALVSNPRIEATEVLEIARNTQAAAGVLQRIAQDRRFSGNYEIQLALVKNPKTPSPIAVRFVEMLRLSDLRDLAKSQALRENIRSAALRTYLKRSSM